MIPMPQTVVCVDCKTEGIAIPRKIHEHKGKPAPGKRCRTHFYARRKAVRTRARNLRIEDLYTLTPEEFQELYEFQGKQCFICHRAKGKTVALHVDHDHSIKDRRKSIRGLLCNTCNRILIGRYDVAALQRAIEYHQDPPAQRYFRQKESSDAT